MNNLWNNVKRKDILKAIKQFDKQKESHPEPRNTFLIYNNKKYPAKHIRGLSYQVANNMDISKNEYSGGKETADFFTKYGFDVEYKSVNNHSKENIEQKINYNKIARIIVTGEQYDENGKQLLNKIYIIIINFIEKVYNKHHFDFILTPGGFLTFELPENLHCKDINQAEKDLSPYHKMATNTIYNFFNNMPNETFKKLQNVADFFTIGIDSISKKYSTRIELVALYDLKNEKIIRWTGKFYPTENQKKYLIKTNDLNTHFIRLNGQNIIILGCHDLNVFNPRGQANAKSESWKRTTADSFKKLCFDFKPDIILQHPHTTDTPNIWNLS